MITKFEDCISETAKKYIKEYNVQIEDSYKANKIYSMLCFKPLEIRNESLMAFADTLEDDNIVRRQILEMINNEKKDLLRIQEKNTNGTIYILRYEYDDGSENIIGFYSTFNKAVDALMSSEEDDFTGYYYIEKEFIDDDYKNYDPKTVYHGKVKYTSNRMIVDINAFSFEDNNENFVYRPYDAIQDSHGDIWFFEKKHMYPHPFRKGDVLKRTIFQFDYQKDNVYRIMTYLRDDNDMLNDINIILNDDGKDSSDCGILPEYLGPEEGAINWTDTREDPYDFDLVEDFDEFNSRLTKSVLETIQGLLRGKGGSLSFVQDYLILQREMMLFNKSEDDISLYPEFLKSYYGYIPLKDENRKRIK